MPGLSGIDRETMGPGRGTTYDHLDGLYLPTNDVNVSHYAPLLESGDAEVLSVHINVFQLPVTR